MTSDPRPGVWQRLAARFRSALARRNDAAVTHEPVAESPGAPVVAEPRERVYVIQIDPVDPEESRRAVLQQLIDKMTVGRRATFERWAAERAEASTSS